MDCRDRDVAVQGTAIEGTDHAVADTLNLLGPKPQNSCGEAPNSENQSLNFRLKIPKPQNPPSPKP